MIEIQEERLLRLLLALGKIGWREGYGLQRPAFGDAFREARGYLQQVLEQAGFMTRVDPVGNLFAGFPGQNPQAKTILTGSHLDAVAGGGILDGAYGVCAAIEAVRSIKEQGVPLRHPLEIVAFQAEEGGPWGGTFGSRCFTGQMETPPADGVLRQIGVSKEDIRAARGETDRYAAFLEAHIEQGPVLWREGKPIGIPTGIVSINRYACQVIGEANHAGTTPLADRKDALYAAASVVTAWLDYVRGQEGAVGNIGIFELSTADATIVPSKVDFIAEIRSLDEQKVQAALDKLRGLLANLSACTASLTPKVKKPAVALSAEIRQTIAEAAAERGLAYLFLPSGASHDASPLARVMPTGMIFVPSIGGISHNQKEASAERDLMLGAQVLTDTMLKLDEKLP